MRRLIIDVQVYCLASIKVVNTVLHHLPER
jgi:hypothetical protein